MENKPAAQPEDSSKFVIKEANFGGATFTGGAIFSGATFTEEANFGGATFTEEANFEDATFTKGANFANATFTKGVNFWGATFTKGVNFGGAIFTGGAIFSGATFIKEAYFANATFTEGAHFEGATFTEAYFADATFTEGAYFQGATFTEGANFAAATFTGVTLFSRVTFTEDAIFAAATFTGEAIFSGATFTEEATFARVTFTEEAIFSGATFTEEATFAGATFESHADFVNSEMKSQTLFDGASFRRTPPLFDGTKLHEGTTWFGVTWPRSPRSVDDARLTVRAYERLKLEMDKLKKHEDELNFSALELKARRVLAGKWSTLHGMATGFYGCLCDYGRSYSRPLWLLGAVAVVGAVPFLFHFGLRGWRGSLALSAANTFGLFGFRREFFSPSVISDLPWTLKLVSAMQTVAGGVLFFLFALALRNRFRMR